MNKIKELRQANGISLAKLSDILKTKYNLNVSPQSIMRYEKGLTDPKMETWQKLADFFGVSVPFMQGYDSKLDALLDNWKNRQILEIVEKLDKLQTVRYDFSYDRKVFDALSILLSIYNKYPKNSHIIDKLNDIIIALQYFEDDISLDELFSDSTLPDYRDELGENVNEEIILSSALQFESLLRLMNDNKNNSN